MHVVQQRNYRQMLWTEMGLFDVDCAIAMV